MKRARTNGDLPDAKRIRIVGPLLMRSLATVNYDVWVHIFKHLPVDSAMRLCFLTPKMYEMWKSNKDWLWNHYIDRDFRWEGSGEPVEVIPYFRHCEQVTRSHPMETYRRLFFFMQLSAQHLYAILFGDFKPECSNDINYAYMHAPHISLVVDVHAFIDFLKYWKGNRMLTMEDAPRHSKIDHFDLMSTASNLAPEMFRFHSSLCKWVHLTHRQPAQDIPLGVHTKRKQRTVVTHSLRVTVPFGESIESRIHYIGDCEVEYHAIRGNYNLADGSSKKAWIYRFTPKLIGSAALMDEMLSRMTTPAVRQYCQISACHANGRGIEEYLLLFGDGSSTFLRNTFINIWKGARERQTIADVSNEVKAFADKFFGVATGLRRGSVDDFFKY